METKQKTFEVSLTPYPTVITVECQNKDEALKIARNEVDFSIWESEVIETENGFPKEA